MTDTGAVFPHKVTMHIGCHGRRELGVVEPPMRLLQSVRGLTYCELPNIEECCGFGGTFSVKMPGTSLAMGDTKVENILKSGAEVVVSNDVSCLMHIGGILRRNPETRHIRTMHIAEVLVAGWEPGLQIANCKLTISNLQFAIFIFADGVSCSTSPTTTPFRSSLAKVRSPNCRNWFPPTPKS